jgi:hypothetical protein
LPMEATHERFTEPALTPEQEAILRAMAARYVWWKTPDDALRFPRQIVAQVMNLGVWEDVQIVANALGDPFLRMVIQTAEAGQFNERSWCYWHYRLHMAKVGAVPPLPERKIA